MILRNLMKKFMSGLMIKETKDEILDELSKNREYYKEITAPIRCRRNQMYKDSSTMEWDEINESYSTAIFLQMYDELSDKLNLPADELYCELETLNLSDFFEPAN